MPNEQRAAKMAARWRADRLAAPPLMSEPKLIGAPAPKGPSCVVCGKRATRAVDKDNGLCHRRRCIRRVMRYKPKGENQE